MKLGVVGGGAMGEAVVAAVLRRKLLAPTDVTVADVVAERREALRARYRVLAASTNGEAAAQADYLVIALKPQDFEKAAAGLIGRLPAAATVVSIMAGVPISRLSGALGHAAVVRAMPNTPAQVGEGMTVWTATEAVSEAARADVGRIFDCLGRQAFVAEERYLDMATAVSGSGPGYVFLFIEALIDAAVHIGLGRTLATEMVLQTVQGSARYAQETGRHPADLRNVVTSPGGTTAEGLKALEAGGLRAAAIDAVVAAYEKSKALGEGPSR